MLDYLESRRKNKLRNLILTIFLLLIGCISLFITLKGAMSYSYKTMAEMDNKSYMSQEQAANEIGKETEREMKKEMNELKSKLKKMEETMEEINRMLGPMYKEFTNSLNKIMDERSIILTEPEEFNMINKAVKERLGRKIVKMKKLHCASQDYGESKFSFHGDCNSKDPQLILVKNDKGRRYGGFVTAIWNGDGTKNDDNSFVFSLDKMKIYKYNKTSKAMFCNKEGFGMGREDNIFIGYHCLNKKSSFTVSAADSNFDFEGDKDALSGYKDGEKFYLEDYEIYHIFLEEDD